MRELKLEEQKQIMLDIMDEIHSFCENNGIKYFLMAGTLIGAIRHNGFIPWDDDIDIGMTRSDYDRFIKEFKSESGRYALKCIETSPKYYMASAKVIDTDTVLYENLLGVDPIGVFVDVFPFDNCGDSYEDAVRFSKKSNIYRKMLAVKNIWYDKKRKKIKNIALAILKLALLPFSRKWIIKRMDSVITSRHSDNPEKYVGDLSLLPYGERGIYEYDWVKETAEKEFEGRMYRIPKEYDAFLKHTYGDYMVLPPKEKQVTHHTIKVFKKDTGK